MCACLGLDCKVRALVRVCEQDFLRSVFCLKRWGRWGYVPAKVSPAGGGAFVSRDSRSSEVWQPVSGYSCRPAMITPHSHSTDLIYSNPHRNPTKSALRPQHASPQIWANTRTTGPFCSVCSIQLLSLNVHLKLQFSLTNKKKRAVQG